MFFHSACGRWIWCIDSEHWKVDLGILISANLNILNGHMIKFNMVFNSDIISKMTGDQSSWTICNIWSPMKPLKLSKSNLSEAKYFEDRKWINVNTHKQLKIYQWIYDAIKLVFVDKIYIDVVESSAKQRLNATVEV